MKRLCALLACLLAVCTCALAEPALTPAPLTGGWEGYISGGGAMVTEAETPIHFSVMTREGDNVLLVLRQRGGVWETDVVARTALRPGDPPGIAPVNENSFSIYYYGDATERYDFAADGTGAFTFQGYQCDRADGTGLRIDFARPGELRYSETHADGRLTVTTLPAARFALGLDSFDAAAFPVTMAEAVALGAPDAQAVAGALVKADPSLGENEYQLPDQTLYDGPDGGIVGWYFAGTEVTVLDDSDPGWVQVQIDNRSGWFRREALAFGAERERVPRRPPIGMVRESYHSNGVSYHEGTEADGAFAGLYEQPDLYSPLISKHITESSDLMRVLGILPGGWLQAEDLYGGRGYIRLLWVNQCADPWAEWPTTRLVAVVLNSDPADRLNLRAYPDKDADTYGKFYSGVRALALFDVQRHEGWRYVRIGDQAGYMMEAFLRYPADWDVVFTPPYAEVTADATLRQEPRLSAKAAYSFQLSAGTRVNVLGTVSDQWYYVQAEPDELGWDGYQGWLPKSQLTRVGPATVK